MRNLLVFNFFQKCLATPVVRLFFVRFCLCPLKKYLLLWHENENFGC